MRQGTTELVEYVILEYKNRVENAESLDYEPCRRHVRERFFRIAVCRMP